MDETQLKRIVEALLVSSNEPLSLDKLQSAFEEWEQPTQAVLKTMIEQLKVDYANHAFELIEVAGGYLLQTKSDYRSWVGRLQSEKPAKYSRALLEILAIIAYKQPVTRGEIEDIRGVSVNSQIIKTLIEREWIRVAGYKDLPGKPAVFATTKDFLNYFKLKHLNELPALMQNEECIINEQ